jgi:SseB protein C-terminal domain
MRFRSRRDRPTTAEVVPAGTQIFIGEPAVPLPSAVLAELADACAADDRVAAAYAFWIYVQLPGEEPHHCVAIRVDDSLSEPDFEALVASLWTRIAALAPSDAQIDFRRLSDGDPAPDGIPPLFTRTA